MQSIWLTKRNNLSQQRKSRKKNKTFTRWGGNASCNRMGLAFGVGASAMIL